MKPKFLFSKLVIAIASAMLIISCSEDVTIPKSTPIPTKPPVEVPGVLNLVADHFEPHGPELVFKNTFAGIMQGRTTTSPSVYVVTSDGETLISSGGTSFMDGEI